MSLGTGLFQVNVSGIARSFTFDVVVKQASISPQNSSGIRTFVEVLVDGKSFCKTLTSTKTWSPTWDHSASVIITPYSSLQFRIVQVSKFGLNLLIGESELNVYNILKANNGKGLLHSNCNYFSILFPTNSPGI